MLLTLSRRQVLGHKVPGLRHLYQPIKSKINQYSNNSPKKINTNYSKIYIILLKLQQITSTNHLDRFIYIPSSGDITKPQRKGRGLKVCPWDLYPRSKRVTNRLRPRSLIWIGKICFQVEGRIGTWKMGVWPYVLGPKNTPKPLYKPRLEPWFRYTSDRTETTKLSVGTNLEESTGIVLEELYNH